MLTSTTLTILLTLAGFLPAVLSFSPSFPYGSEKVRGVSLGGWLLLEPWITPSIFDNTGNPDIIDEWTFCQLQDKNVSTKALKDHWDSFITEDDFAAIAAAGLNHVRVPIGYWAWNVTPPAEPYIRGQLTYLRNAVMWASNYGLKLIIDLHGLPGSQNGYDNSGRKLPFAEWQSSSINIDRTNSIFQSIAEEFGPQYQTVAAIEPVNEPAGFYGESMLGPTREYYLSSYTTLRSYSANTLQLIQDAFQPLSYWNDLEPFPGHEGVALDTHIYQIFSDDQLALLESEHISAACAQASNLQSFNQLWLIVGEWTPVMTDCAPYFNGRGIGSRYDGSYPGSPGVGSCSGLTGPGASFSQDYVDFLRQLWEAQVITYEKADGWIMWTWKTEQADEWSYQAGLKYGWIPSDPTAFLYPDICGS